MSVGMVKVCPPPVQVGISRSVVCGGEGDALKRSCKLLEKPMCKSNTAVGLFMGGCVLQKLKQFLAFHGSDLGSIAQYYNLPK